MTTYRTGSRRMLRHGASWCSRGLRTSFALLCVLALTAHPVQAATFTILNANDAGAWSLRQGVINGDTPINWDATTGGQITLLSDLPAINADTTLDVTAANAAVIIAPAAAEKIPLGGAVTFANDHAAQDWTISAIISGAGSITKTGARTLLLSGANTYTGGTTINGGTVIIGAANNLGDSSGALMFGGGTLQTTAGLTLTRNIGMSGNGTFNTNGNDSTLSGTISGSGALTKTGAGILTLTGTNSYYGGTTINGGTIIINSYSSLGYAYSTLTLDGGTVALGAGFGSVRPVTLGAGGGTIDTAGFNMDLLNVISGAGALTKTGTGGLSLADGNTYTGGTVINAGGSIRVLTDSALGGAAGPLTFNGGGTLEIFSDFTSARSITLNAGGGTINTDTGQTTLNGVISGGGALTKTGAGLLLLTRANTYTGGTTVNAGTLQLGANNGLPDNETLNLNAGGTFNLGSYTQNLDVYNDVGTGGTLKMELLPAVTNLTVAGNANLTNGTLEVSLGKQTVTAGQVFTPITYGSVTGTLTNINGPAAITFTPAYNAGDLTLTAGLVPFADIALGANQRGVGAALEPLRANPSGDMASVLAELYAMDAHDLRKALDQISPVSLGAMAGASMGGAGLQSAAVSQRLAALTAGAGASLASSSGFNDRSPHPGTLFAAAGIGDIEPSKPDDHSDWGTFASAMGTTGRLREATSNAGSQPGYAFNGGGLIAGADYRFDEHLAAGLAGGYVYNHASIYSPGSGTTDSHSMRLGAYGTTFNDEAHANLYVGGALDFFSTRRGIRFGDLSRTASAKPWGGEINVDTSVGYDFRAGSLGTFSPFAGLSYDRLMVDSFTEEGAGSLNLAVSKQASRSCRSRIGLRYSDKLDGETFFFIPYASLGWRHEFLSQSRAIEAQLASGAGTVFSVDTGDYARDGTLLGAGFALKWRRFEVRLDYSGDFRSHFMQNLFNGSARFRF